MSLIIYFSKNLWKIIRACEYLSVDSWEKKKEKRKKKDTKKRWRFTAEERKENWKLTGLSSKSWNLKMKHMPEWFILRKQEERK